MKRTGEEDMDVSANMTETEDNSNDKLQRELKDARSLDMQAKGDTHSPLPSD